MNYNARPPARPTEHQTDRPPARPPACPVGDVYWPLTQCHFYDFVDSYLKPKYIYANYTFGFTKPKFLQYHKDKKKTEKRKNTQEEKVNIICSAYDTLFIHPIMLIGIMQNSNQA